MLIYVCEDPINPEKRICSIRGKIENIDLALKMIRQNFPENRFPDIEKNFVGTLM